MKRECSDVKNELARISASKSQLEKKHHQLQLRHQKLQAELDEEKQLGEMSRKDKEVLMQKNDALEQLRKKVSRFYTSIAQPLNI